jgi:hypothetical protein
MADTSRGIVKYTSRDYGSIMQDFWNIVPALTDLWKPEADSDPGVVLGKFLASAADMLGVNTDWIANEIFAPSVTQRKNAEKLFSIIGYKLGWFIAAKTEVTFINNTDSPMLLDFGFANSNFATLNAYADITGQPRVITYNIIPMSSSYGEYDTRSTRKTITDAVSVFSGSDRVTLEPKGSVTRVAIEGELRNYSVTVEQVKDNNYIIKLPSQHLDTTAIWVEAVAENGEKVGTRWVQVDSVADFVNPEPRFAVTYDNYGNAQLQVSNYLNQMENYENNVLIIHWIECSGVIGSVGTNVLQNLVFAVQPLTGSTVNMFSTEDIKISNLPNTVEMPHTYTVTGRSPETAKEAYFNSRNYINTWDSLITLPDFNRFLNREAGVDCGLVIDCQRALEINKAIYKNPNLTEAQKSKMYITSFDFPVADKANLDWRGILGDIDITKGVPFTVNFKTLTAVCYAIHNDFNDSSYGAADILNPYNTGDRVNIRDGGNYIRYKPPYNFIDGVIADFRPLQAMTVDMQFGYARIFPWFVVGEIYPVTPVSSDVASAIVAKVKESLALFFAPANRSFGQKPTVMEVVQVVESADPRIKYFDAGSINNPVINWGERVTRNGTNSIRTYDIEYFNPISFAMYKDTGAGDSNIRIAPDWIV